MRPSTSGTKHSVWERMSRLWLRRDRNSPVERKALALDASRVKLSAMKQVRRCRKYILLHCRKQEASCDGNTATNTRTDPACLDARSRTDRQGRRAAPPAIGRE